MHATGLWIALFFLPGWLPPDDYVSDIEAQRREKDARFSDPSSSPLATRAIWRLKEGEQVIGLGSDIDLKFGAEWTRPRHARVTWDDQGIFLESLEGMVRTVPPDWAPGNRSSMVSGIHVERVEWEFGEKYELGEAIVVLDRHPVGPVLRLILPWTFNAEAFTGLKYFPVNSDFRVRGRVQPGPMQALTVVDTQGWERPGHVYGKLQFQLEGRSQELDLLVFEAEPATDSQFMLIFQDQTSGKESYPACRYLYLPFQKEGAIWVDFNLAFNPYCAYANGFACPLPLPGNRLDVAVRAGEKTYHSEQ